MPKRIQRKRTKGWRKPEGAVCVDRPSKWGNLHLVGVPCVECEGAVHSAKEAVMFFRWDLMDDWLEISETDVKRELHGKDLVAWCKLDADCHADVLLEIANG